MTRGQRAWRAGSSPRTRVLDSSSSSTQARTGCSAPDRVVDPVVALGQRTARVREPVELEVVVAVDEPVRAVQLLEHGVQRPRLLDGLQPERGHGLAASRLPARPRCPARAARARTARAPAWGTSRRPRRSAVTSRAPTTCVARPPSRAPVPCVPVEIAPAIVCRSMSPRLRIARPCDASVAFRAASRMPAPTVTSVVPSPVRRRRSTASSASRRSCTPSVTAAAVNEWPAPTARTVRPCPAASATQAASSPTSRGRATRVGRDAAVRAQFTQCSRDAASPMTTRVRLNTCPSQARTPCLAIVVAAASIAGGGPGQIEAM